MSRALVRCTVVLVAIALTPASLLAQVPPGGLGNEGKIFPGDRLCIGADPVVTGTSKRKSPSMEAAAAPQRPGYFAVLRDDFHDRFGLKWKIVREDKSHLSLTKHPGRLTITTQRGTIHGDVDHDASTDGIRAKNIFLIPNPLADTSDFSITLAVSKFAPTTFYQQVGLLCYDDDANYVKWGYEYAWQEPNTTNFIMVRQTEMEPEHDLRVVVPNPGKFWMRVTRRGNQYECAYSTDGRDFKVAGSRPWGEHPPKYLGFLAKNGGNPDAPEIDVCIDSFELRALPGASDRQPSATPLHSGSVTHPDAKALVTRFLEAMRKGDNAVTCSVRGTRPSWCRSRSCRRFRRKPRPEARASCLSRSPPW
jgi:regulation of enolase protein 1 (concanavalin A-like superfamily)